MAESRSSSSGTTATLIACSSSEGESHSLVSKLRAPTASELGRKCKIDANPPPKGKKRSTQNVRKFHPKTV